MEALLRGKHGALFSVAVLVPAYVVVFRNNVLEYTLEVFHSRSRMPASIEKFIKASCLSGTGFQGENA